MKSNNQEEEKNNPLGSLMAPPMRTIGGPPRGSKPAGQVPRIGGGPFGSGIQQEESKSD